MKHVKDDLVSLVHVHPHAQVHRATLIRVFQGTLGGFISTKKSGLNFRQLPVLAN